MFETSCSSEVTKHENIFCQLSELAPCKGPPARGGVCEKVYPMLAHAINNIAKMQAMPQSLRVDQTPKWLDVFESMARLEIVGSVIVREQLRRPK